MSRAGCVGLRWERLFAQQRKPEMLTFQRFERAGDIAAAVRENLFSHKEYNHIKTQKLTLTFKANDSYFAEWGPRYR